MVRSFHTYLLIPLLGPGTVKGIDDTKPSEAVFALNCLWSVWMQSRELPASARAAFRLYSTALLRYDSAQSRCMSSLEGLHSWKFYSLFSLMPRWPIPSAKVWLVLSLDTALFFPPSDRVCGRSGILEQVQHGTAEDSEGLCACSHQGCELRALRLLVTDI